MSISGTEKVLLSAATTLCPIKWNLAQFLNVYDIRNLSLSSRDMSIFLQFLKRMNISMSRLQQHHKGECIDSTIMVNSAHQLPIFERFFVNNFKLYPFELQGEVVSNSYRHPYNQTDRMRQLSRILARHRNPCCFWGVAFSTCDCLIVIRNQLSQHKSGTLTSGHKLLVRPMRECCDSPNKGLHMAAFGLKRVYSELTPDVALLDSKRVCRASKDKESPSEKRVAIWSAVSPGTSLPVETLSPRWIEAEEFRRKAEKYILCSYSANGKFCGDPAIFNREEEIHLRRCGKCTGLTGDEQALLRHKQWVSAEDYEKIKIEAPKLVFCSCVSQGLVCAKVLCSPTERQRSDGYCVRCFRETLTGRMFGGV